MLKHSELSKSDREARLHYFRTFRSEGQPALLAWISALSYLRFVQRLRKDVTDSAKRSKAAKKAWKSRKANILLAA